MTCSDCSDKTVGNNGNVVNTVGCPAAVGATYISSSTSLTGNSTNINPYTDYTVHVQARNRWGYGEEGDWNFTSAQYISGSPGISNISSVFPDSKLLLQWRAPSVPNGAVSEFIVVLNNGYNGACIAVWRVTCSDCSDKTVGDGGARADAGCSGLSVVASSYNSGQPPSILSNSDVILPNMDYTVVLQARNGWGNGNVTTKSLKTAPKSLQAPSITEETLQAVMASSSTSSSQTIMLTLPLSAFRSVTDDIRKFTIVVSSIPSTLTANQRQPPFTSSYLDKTYGECRGVSSNCTYEVLYYNYARRKRAANQSPLQNTQFLLGASASCESQEHLCNGPLTIGTTYKIALRVYSPWAIATVGVIEKATTRATEPSTHIPTSVTTATTSIVPKIVGGVFGGVIFVGLVAGLTVWLMRRRAPKKESNPYENGSPSTMQIGAAEAGLGRHDNEDPYDNIYPYNNGDPYDNGDTYDNDDTEEGTEKNDLEKQQQHGYD